jgi:6-phosphofructokinase 2
MLQANLEAFGLDQRVIPIAGITRENFTIDEAETGNQYRFILPGPPLSDPELRQCFEAVETLQPLPSYFVVSGGYPPDAAAAELSEAIARLAKRMGARLVLDTSQSMRDAPEHGVFLMKPSLSELGWMTGRAHATRAEQIEAARSLIETGRAVVVVVSLGADGALLVTDTLAKHFPTPEVPALSAVGAGDSMVGAIVLALHRGWSLTDAVRYGVAAGAATIMTPGTEMCHPEDVDRLFNEMSAIPEAARV